MQLPARLLLAFLILVAPAASTWADEYSDTVKIFMEAGESGDYFKTAYGYAVFPTVGKGGFGIGGAYGKGRVYKHEQYVGDTTMTQVSLGLQLGGQAYSQILFFEDKRAFDEFTGGNFELGAQATAVAITAAASAAATTAGSSAGISGGKRDAETKGAGYNKGLAIFTVAKGGLMYEVSVAGQKFGYTPKK
jgi:lipid-binding SYLF domain-containing protein